MILRRIYNERENIVIYRRNKMKNDKVKEFLLIKEFKNNAGVGSKCPTPDHIDVILSNLRLFNT